MLTALKVIASVVARAPELESSTVNLRDLTKQSLNTLGEYLSPGLKCGSMFVYDSFHKGWCMDFHNQDEDRDLFVGILIQMSHKPSRHHTESIVECAQNFASGILVPGHTYTISIDPCLNDDADVMETFEFTVSPKTSNNVVALLPAAELKKTLADQVKRIEAYKREIEERHGRRNVA